MQKQTLILLIVALAAIAAGSFLAPQLFEPAPAPVVQWETDDEVDGAEQEQPGADAIETAGFERTEAEAEAVPVAAPVSDEPRVEALLRGRVVDKFAQPVAGAKVWLEIGRGRGNNAPRGRGGRGGRDRGRSRRIPDPVVTNADGLFAFQGQAFRNLRVNLQVKSDDHAVGLFEKDMGDIQAGSAGAATLEVSLGDLQLKSGGLVRGRVTDLDGNGVVDAEVTMEPDFRNRLRWQQNRRELLPTTKTDRSGYYAYPNVPAGRFAVTVLAKMHTPGRSDGFDVEEDAVLDVPDIALGPGYEVTGYVRDSRGEPVAGANVRLRRSLSANAQSEERQERGRPQERGGRGGWRSMARMGGRDQNVETDEEGRFFVEHLPSAMLELRVRAEGFLDHEQDEIDPKLQRPIYVTMQEGLRITGLVQSPSASPVTAYAVSARRLRDLPDPNQPKVDFNDLMAKLQKPDLSEEDRRALMRQMRGVRDSFAGSFRGVLSGGRGGWSGGRGREREATKPEAHPGGRFALDGLQEGVYQVTVEAPEYSQYRSEEVEVRGGMRQPDLTITLDGGVYVAGVVLDRYGDPIADAEVTLRTATPEAQGQLPVATRGRDGGRGGRGGRGGFDANRMAQQWMQSMNGPPTRMQARTDRDGLFFLKHAPRGLYTLSATAENYAEARVEPFQLESDRSDFELQLDPLGVLVGEVTGFRPEESGEVQVGALMMPEDGNIMSAMMSMRGGRGGGGRSTTTTKVQPDGSYRLEGLKPGNYIVRTWLGDFRQMMRTLQPTLMSGDLVADVNVRAGVETSWDMQLERPQLGAVTGTVLRNGENARGLRVELRREETGGQPAGGMDPMMARFMNFGRSQSDEVGADGRFEIKDVNAGAYTLRITAGRRGGVLYEEPLQVVAEVTAERSFSLTVGSLTGAITTDDGADPKQIRGDVALVRDLLEVPEDLDRFLRENQSFRARVSGGRFEISSLPAGTYLLIARLRDRERTTQTVVVAGTEEVSVAAGKATAQNGGAPK